MRSSNLMVAAVVALACLSTVANAETADPNARRIVVTDGVSLVAAPSWSSCDAAINQKIGSEAPAPMLERFCTSPPPPDMAVRLVKMQTGGFSILLVAASKTLEAEFPAANDAANLAKAKAEVCDKLGAKFFAAGDCNIAPITLPGLQAWGGHAIIATEKGLTQHMRIVAFALDKHPVLLMFDRMYFGDPPAKYEDDPDVETMLTTITEP